MYILPNWEDNKFVMWNTTDELLEKIDQMKLVLLQTAEDTGINSNDTICCSQDLDKLIFNYQNLVQRSRLVAC
jgi:hypothetical protein